MSLLKGSKQSHNYGTLSQAEEGGEQLKSSDKARSAFAANNVDASRAEHRKKTSHAGERERREANNGFFSRYRKPIVFGGMDGLLTCFALVAAAVGSDSSFKILLIMTLANVFADGISMGAGEYVSGNAEREFKRKEREREEWEVKNYKDLEKQEMVAVYQSKGIDYEDAVQIVEIISKDDKTFVDFMMVDELQILMADEEEGAVNGNGGGALAPAKEGFAMFCSFIFFGLIPVIPYLLNNNDHGPYSGGGRSSRSRSPAAVASISSSTMTTSPPPMTSFIESCVLVLLALIGLGYMKAVITSASKVKMCLSMVVSGAVVGGLSYVISVELTHLLRGSE